MDGAWMAYVGVVAVAGGFFLAGYLGGYQRGLKDGRARRRTTEIWPGSPGPTSPRVLVHGEKTTLDPGVEGSWDDWGHPEEFSYCRHRKRGAVCEALDCDHPSSCCPVRTGTY